MNVIQWLLAKISQILLASKNKQRMDNFLTITTRD